LIGSAPTPLVFVGAVAPLVRASRSMRFARVFVPLNAMTTLFRALSSSATFSTSKLSFVTFFCIRRGRSVKRDHTLQLLPHGSCTDLLAARAANVDVLAFA
jgi:hypothetical protein